MEYISLCAHLVELFQTHSQHSFGACRSIINIIEAKCQFRAARTAVEREGKGDIVTDGIVFRIEGVAGIDRNCQER